MEHSSYEAKADSVSTGDVSPGQLPLFAVNIVMVQEARKFSGIDFHIGVGEQFNQAIMAEPVVLLVQLDDLAGDFRGDRLVALRLAHPPLRHRTTISLPSRRPRQPASARRAKLTVPRGSLRISGVSC